MPHHFPSTTYDTVGTDSRISTTNTEVSSTLLPPDHPCQWTWRPRMKETSPHPSNYFGAALELHASQSVKRLSLSLPIIESELSGQKLFARHIPRETGDAEYSLRHCEIFLIKQPPVLSWETANLPAERTKLTAH